MIADAIAKDRSCGVMKFTVKETLKLSFDINATASTISFFINIYWIVDEAKHTTNEFQTRINSQKVEGTIFRNMVIGF